MHLAVCSYHVRHTFHSESTIYICLNVKKLLARNRPDIQSLSDCYWTQIHNHLVSNKFPTIWPNWSNDWAELWVLISMVHLTVFYYHFMNAFESESTLFIFLNVKELLAQNRNNIWSLSDSNLTWTQNQLVSKRTLNHLAKLTKWLSWVGSTYLCSACDCIFSSCHVSLSEWIHTLNFPQCQGSFYSKQVPYLKFQWL